MPTPGAAAIPSDADWLDAAARLAMRGRPSSRPNPAVGAIIVRDGVIVGRGWTRPGGRPHAEAAALQQAGSAVRGADVFVTLEPCAHRSERGPACAELLADAAPARVIVGCGDPDPRTAGKGIARLRAAGIGVQLLDHTPSRDSLAGYLVQRRLGRPHVTLKLALSLDGRIALPDGSSRWITGEMARAHVHSRRALADAILVGGGTWRDDAPALDVRLSGLEDRSPRRLVLTRGEAPKGAQAISTPQDIADLKDTQYLYIEGGAGTAAAFLAADLVDRLDIYRAPILIGSGRPAIEDIGLGALDEAHGRWALVENCRLGSDGFEAYRRLREG
ncbi:bifunctional diaminohydroxyphosphoribosylaminopyrimidine deaminase/5-amino-6-(5-phosphoribosylamino)uracil reductase RibD [Qipengyuania sp. MTN3-11]|uniref:bifunctional diaminohydroxyphosphoribosylaminopyrimidine deaminase/5-amino-6-(5-phosphoribosylamino)uracil reductase RibD n=1 Tax=Qipengyuania sp. MTN3-11 TaxID=3056557 RepID=UPI0036F1AA2F